MAGEYWLKKPTRDVKFKCDAWRLCKMAYLHCDHYSEHKWRVNCWYTCPFEEDAECKEIKEVKNDGKKKKWWQFWKKEHSQAYHTGIKISCDTDKQG
jgi:hypothetical protein